MPEPSPAPRRPEPPLIERARRIGWLLVALCLICLALSRFDPARWGWWIGAAVASGVIGWLAIANVALVRGIYRQLPPPDACSPKAGEDVTVTDPDQSR